MGRATKTAKTASPPNLLQKLLAERSREHLRLALLLERPSDAEKVLRIIDLLGGATPEEIEEKLRSINLPMPIERVRNRVTSLARRGYIARLDDGRWAVSAQEVR
jgi:hypothetical protein